jgi:hypothetical protein
MWAVGCVEDSCCWPCTPICLDLKFVHNTHFCSYSKFVQIHFFKFDFCVDLELVQIQFFFTTWNLFIFQRCPYIPNLSIIQFFSKKRWRQESTEFKTPPIFIYVYVIIPVSIILGSTFWRFPCIIFWHFLKGGGRNFVELWSHIKAILIGFDLSFSRELNQNLMLLLVLLQAVCVCGECHHHNRRHGLATILSVERPVVVSPAHGQRCHYVVSHVCDMSTRLHGMCSPSVFLSALKTIYSTRIKNTPPRDRKQQQ